MKNILAYAIAFAAECHKDQVDAGAWSDGVCIRYLPQLVYIDRKKDIEYRNNILHIGSW